MIQPWSHLIFNLMAAQHHIAYISVGSNMGDRALNCENGISALGKSASVRILNQSLFYLTEPVDYLDQDWFINAAIKIQTQLDSFQLLTTLKLIEENAGRESNRIRFGPRVLDMDIVFYDNAIINTPNLVIPHPRMHNRCFILQPLCDIDPDIVHPVFRKSVQNLLENLDDHCQKVIPYPC